MYITLRPQCKKNINQLHGNKLRQINDRGLNENQQVAPILAQICEGNFGLIWVWLEFGDDTYRKSN